MTKTHYWQSALLALCLIFALTLPVASAEEDWDLPTSEPGGDIIIDDLWDTPCIAEPYDETYEDSYRSIKIKRIEWDNSVAFIADVQLKDAGDFHAGSAGGGFDTISVMAQQAGAVLAINADDYGTHNYGIIIRDGSRIRANSTTRHLVAVLPDGSLEMVGDHSRDNAKAVAARLEKENVMHTFEFGPILVQDGAAVSFPKSFNVISTRDSRREPRTGIGMIDPLHYVLIVVDGRQPGYSDGISLQSLQSLFVLLGAANAINLDGGGSTEMWFQGVILNEPAGGTERELSDCIYF